jgi:hypothetical protein
MNVVYEQLEMQRKNPHLYTTMYQCVNPDGSITTFEQITEQLRNALDKLQEGHTKRFGGNHPVYCMRPVIGQPEVDVCQAIEMIEKDIDRCKLGFVENYARFNPPNKELFKEIE